MPSWNIHTAHVERLLAEPGADALGIADANAFLFGNYVPDIYVGFMVADTTFRVDYCLTHLAQPATIPLPDADQFWEESILHPLRKPQTPVGVSLALGAWAHLVADRVYNARFREFCETRDVPEGDELRIRKQADFALFGRTLATSLRVDVTPGLLEAAQEFRPYSILPADVERAVDVADSLLQREPAMPDAGDYRLLGADWMAATFDACHEQIAAGLEAFKRTSEEAGGKDATTADRP